MARKNTKEKIFDVSIDLFSEYGYNGVSIRQIAKEVGIKESSIYNHYKSKESILESILTYYIEEMLKEEAPIMQSNDNLDIGFEYFYKEGSDRFVSKLREDKMMKITRIFIVGSYHNPKIRNFVKEGIIGYAIKGWEELFNLMKEKNIIKEDANSKQLAESFYSYGMFLLYEHFIINYPEDDEEFLKDFERNTTDHMRIIFNSVKTGDKEFDYYKDKDKKSIESKDNHRHLNKELMRLEEEKDYEINKELTRPEEEKHHEINKELTRPEEEKNHEINKELTRPEEEKDYEKVENLVRDAFWNVYRPGAYEHYIVHRLRDDSSFIKDLAYVIEENGKIIGNINYSKGKLNLYKENRYGVDIKINKGDSKAVVLGPIAIAPKYQKQGFGFRLIKHTLKLAKDKNIPYVFVIGDENYYSRFGFESASKYNLFLEGTDMTQENPFFMIKIFENEIKDLDFDKGIFYNPKVFDVNEHEVDEFDKNFEFKEKKIIEGQLEELK